MTAHRIRLPWPWSIIELQMDQAGPHPLPVDNTRVDLVDATARQTWQLERRFQRPTGLQDADIVRFEFALCVPDGQDVDLMAVELNQRPLVVEQFEPHSYSAAIPVQSMAVTNVIAIQCRSACAPDARWLTAAQLVMPA